MEDIRWLAALNCVPDLGPVKIMNLLRHFGSAWAVFAAAPGDLTQVKRVGESEAKNILALDVERTADSQLESAHRACACMLSFDHAEYPTELRALSSMPVILYGRGQVRSSYQPALAVVGTRRPSPLGRDITTRFALAAAGRGFTIISGLARGVDSLAHRAALQAQSRTVAVLGCGLDVTYPPENGELAGRIAENGALLTEYPFGTPPESRNFPRRNRLIAALSRAVLITEAGAQSGALLTGRFTLEQKKPLLIVPGSINSDFAQGSNAMLRRGGRAVLCPEDLLEELNLAPGVPIPETAPPVLPAPQDRIYGILSADPLHVDQIAAQCRLNAAQALASLFTLEIKGLVQQLGGKKFVRTSPVP